MNVNDYCFHMNKSYRGSFYDVFEDGGLNSKYTFKNITYGTVGVQLKFDVDVNFLYNNNSSIIYSNFTGEDIGTQIRGWPLLLTYNQCSFI